VSEKSPSDWPSPRARRQSPRFSMSVIGLKLNSRKRAVCVLPQVIIPVGPQGPAVFSNGGGEMTPGLSANRKLSRNGLLGTARAIDFPPRARKKAHCPHTCAAHRAGIYRWVGEGMEDRPKVGEVACHVAHYSHTESINPHPAFRTHVQTIRPHGFDDDSGI
jgi:hypothetical protein